MMNMKAAIIIASQKELISISGNITLCICSYTYLSTTKYTVHAWTSLSLTQKLKNITGIIGDGMGIK